MANSPSNALAELLARAERRKHEELRRKLGLPAELKVEGVELESLAYHLTERSGSVFLILEADGVLRVGETKSSVGLRYRNAALKWLLMTWGLSMEEAALGVTFEVEAGQRKR